MSSFSWRRDGWGYLTCKCDKQVPAETWEKHDCQPLQDITPHAFGRVEVDACTLLYHTVSTLLILYPVDIFRISALDATDGKLSAVPGGGPDPKAVSPSTWLKHEEAWFIKVQWGCFMILLQCDIVTICCNRMGFGWGKQALQCRCGLICALGKTNRLSSTTFPANGCSCTA